MIATERFELLLIAIPIGLLLILGLGIALRSGVPTLATEQGIRVVFVNLSKTLLLLFICAVSMAFLHLAMDVPLLPL